MASIYDQIDQERAKRSGMRNIGKNLLIGAAGALAPVTGGLSLAAIPVIKGVEYATQRKSEKPEGFGEYALDMAKDTLPAVAGYGTSTAMAGTGLGKLFGNIKPIAKDGAYISKNAPTHAEGGVNVEVEAGEVIIPEDMQKYIDEAGSEEEKAKRYEQVMAQLKSQPLGEGDKATYGGVPMSTSLYDATSLAIKSLQQLPSKDSLLSQATTAYRQPQTKYTEFKQPEAIIDGGTLPSITVTRDRTFEEKSADYDKNVSRNQKILSGLQAGIAGASILQNALGKDSEKYVPEMIEKKELKSPLTEMKNLYNQSISSDRNMIYKTLRERGADTSTMLGVHANVADARNKQSAEMGRIQKEHEGMQAQLDLGVEQANVGAINQGEQWNQTKELKINEARAEAQKGNWLGMINALGNIYDVDAQLGKQGITRDYLFKMLEDNKGKPDIQAQILQSFFKI